MLWFHAIRVEIFRHHTLKAQLFPVTHVVYNYILTDVNNYCAIYNIVKKSKVLLVVLYHELNCIFIYLGKRWKCLFNLALRLH